MKRINSLQYVKKLKRTRSKVTNAKQKEMHSDFASMFIGILHNKEATITAPSSCLPLIL